jgi:hypothetical protein
VVPEHRQEGLYVYDGTVSAVRNAAIGTPTMFEDDPSRYFEGVFNIPIMSRGESCIVELHNDTPYPCKFSTCEWIGLLASKSK